MPSLQPKEPKADTDCAPLLGTGCSNKFKRGTDRNQFYVKPQLGNDGDR